MGAFLIFRGGRGGGGGGGVAPAPHSGAPPLPVAPAPQPQPTGGGGGPASPTVTAPSGAPAQSSMPSAEFVTLGNPEYITLQDEIFVALSAQAAGGTVILGGRIQLLSGEVHRFHYEIAVTAGSFVLRLFQVAEGTLLSMAVTPLNFPAGQSVGVQAGLATGTLTNPTITSVLIEGTLFGAAPIGNQTGGGGTAGSGQLLPFRSRTLLSFALGANISFTNPNVSAWRLVHLAAEFVAGSGQGADTPVFQLVDNNGVPLWANGNGTTVASGLPNVYLYYLGGVFETSGANGPYQTISTGPLPAYLILNGGANSDKLSTAIPMAAGSQWTNVYVEFEFAP